MNEDKLRNIISLHIPDNMLNQGGHYSELVATLDKSKARSFLETLSVGTTVLPFQVSAKADRLLRDFIARGGFDIDELIEEHSVTPYSIGDNDEISLAAEP